ncbi:MAG: histidine phosphatase family protein [Atopobiaceae bacterium]|nr:histidine phosphatase family protein [Atopobiaceae bacterium]
MPKMLYLTRHGQTIFNTRGIVQGWCDSPLTELGRDQAELARAWFEERGITFDHAYSSPAERASDTVEIITRGEVPFERTKGLKEFNYGCIEGNSYQLVLPGTYNPYGDFLVPFGGNSEDEVIERMRSTLVDIMERPRHQSVLAVSHGACTRAFISSCDATSTLHVPNRVSKNCTINVLEYEDGIFNLVERYEPDDSLLA